MKRGDVWWVSFATATGGEIQKTRPAVIVSNDGANAHANRVQVVPLSSQTAKVFSCEVLVHVQGRLSKAMADQIATVSKQRVLQFFDRLSTAELQRVEQAIRLQLSL